MKQFTTAVLAALLGITAAEVPQEHSHEQFLRAVTGLVNINNRLEIQDAVFGLLGNAAAANGAGQVTNLDCLHQITADEAFTNALTIQNEADRITGLANALIFAALERNTGSVGLASVLCNENAVNAAIDVLSQHQDPASDNAAAINKEITLNLAVELAKVGADPTLALLSGTFSPGDVNDPTGAGNTCNDANDAVGCIFSTNLIIADATVDEINAAVAAAMGNSAPEANAASASDLGALASSMVSAGATASASQSAGAASSNQAATNNNNNQASATVNVQTFTGALGGPAPPVISSASDRPFEVNGATFLNAGAAIQRSCAVQHNACANAANSGQVDGGVQACDAQEDACRAQAAVQRRQALDLGSCSDPTIQFAVGLDGRKEASFGPSNSADFNHGSALNINIISGFICQRLDSSCKADAATVSACQAGASAAQGLQGQAAADAFNSALGF